MAQKFDARQTISRDVLANLLGINGTELDDLLRAVNKEFNAPMRLSASSPADAKLNIQPSEVEAADLAAKNPGPVTALVPSLVASTIDFQTGSTTGGTFSVTFPNSTVGFFRRVGFSLSPAGVIQVTFSSEAASFGSVPDAGTVFVKGSIPLGWLDVEATAASPGRFKTRGSATNIIENKVGSNNTLHRVISPVAQQIKFLDTDFAIQDATDSTKQIAFDAAGTTGTTTTLVGSQTANRSLTLPDITDTLVARTAVEALSGKQVSFSSLTDSSTTGSNTTLGAFATGIVRLTNSSLVSLSGIPAGASGQFLILENKTGNQITINNEETTATAVNRLQTGKGANVAMPNNATMAFTYDSTSQRWQLTAGSGSGGGSGDKNYLSAIATTQSATPNTGNGDFELGSTTGWSLGTVGTLTNGLPTGTPTFGSGASGNLSIAPVSTNHISGSFSLSYASSAATTQGNMLASDVFNIDNSDQAKVLSWKFAYKAQTNPTNANWSGTSSNSFAVAVWDVTNSAWLQCPGGFSMTQNAGIGIAAGSVQTATNTTQLRFVVYNMNATSGAITVYFDDFTIGPKNNNAAGRVIALRATGNPASATSGNSIIWPTVEYDTAGAYNASTGIFTAPVSGFYRVHGYAGLTTAASTTLYIKVNANATVVAIGQSIGTGNSWYNFSGTVLVNAGDQISASPNATVDIGGSNAFHIEFIGLNGNGADDGRAVAFSASNGGFSVPSGGTLTTPTSGWTTSVDTYAGFNPSTGLWTVPVSGVYAIQCSASVANTAFQVRVDLSVNGTQLAIGETYANGTVTPNAIIEIKRALNAGDTVRMRVASFGGSANTVGTNTWFNIERLNGGNVSDNTSAVVAMEAVGSPPTGTLVNGNENVVIFGTKVNDTHNRYDASTGIYTVPVSGYYDVSGAIYVTGTFANNGAFAVNVSVNGTIVRSKFLRNSAGSGDMSFFVDANSIKLNAGDQVRITATPAAWTSVNFSNSTGRNFFNIAMRK